jgi:hypothetical protein
MNKYEILETCLKELEQGENLDTILFRRPELADELRPLLETAAKAKAIAVTPPSEAIVRANRARLLQRAAELREQKAVLPARRLWSVPLRRALVALTVIAMLFISGTSLVRASTTTLPGDSLYPVKRTWEDLSLLFIFDKQQREALEFQHENERLEELQELLARGRTATVDFAGYVTRQSPTEWLVSGIPVFLSADTIAPLEPVAIGAAVRVHGKTQGTGVLAEWIQLLPPGTRLPKAEEHEEHNDQDEEHTPVLPPPTQIPAPAPTPTPTLTPAFEPTITAAPVELSSIEGTVTSIQNQLIVVNGIVLETRFAEEIKGTPAVGVFAKAKGYYDAGIFIVKKIEFIPLRPSSAPTLTPKPDKTPTPTPTPTTTITIITTTTITTTTTTDFTYREELPALPHPSSSLPAQGASKSCHPGDVTQVYRLALLTWFACTPGTG